MVDIVFEESDELFLRSMGITSYDVPDSSPIEPLCIAVMAFAAAVLVSALTESSRGGVIQTNLMRKQTLNEYKLIL